MWEGPDEDSENRRKDEEGSLHFTLTYTGTTYLCQVEFQLQQTTDLV